ncbi:hypothetical protein [Alienimonas chondri]|uniref:Porin n=1 Tax=Alienimonas chondri TaxID=2681879 RepID=A0ABX1VGI3_9PLAN|nr:hypothetical protein [Alienimonas chondri]NNJ26660.1 hypothetical protein [Alienimonas chondri]
MTAPAALLLAALAQSPVTDYDGADYHGADDDGAFESVIPATLSGAVATPPAPPVSSLLSSRVQAAPVIRGQSPGWNPAVPVGPGYGQSGVPNYGQPMGPTYGQPAGPSYGHPAGPTTPIGPEFAPPRYQETYGVNGPQPYDFAPEFRFDGGHIFSADAEGRPDRFSVSEFDFRYEVDSPGAFGDVITVAPEYSLRTLSGPSTNPLAGQPPLPGALHRLGVDFAVMTPKYNGFSATAGFTPSFASDFEEDLTEAGRQYDGRAALFYDVAPDLTLVAGAKYYDRVDDLILPWVGAVWRPGDRWEIRAVFPNPRIEYFWGPMLGKPMWVYAEGQFNRESWQYSPRNGAGPIGSLTLPEVDEVQFDDLRFIVGARKEQGWGRTFLEAGVVFNRDVSFRKTPSQNFEVGESLILRGGVRF